MCGTTILDHWRRRNLNFEVLSISQQTDVDDEYTLATWCSRIGFQQLKVSTTDTFIAVQLDNLKKYRNIKTRWFYLGHYRFLPRHALNLIVNQVEISMILDFFLSLCTYNL